MQSERAWTDVQSLSTAQVFLQMLSPHQASQAWLGEQIEGLELHERAGVTAAHVPASLPASPPASELASCPASELASCPASDPASLVSQT